MEWALERDDLSVQPTGIQDLECIVHDLHSMARSTACRVESKLRTVRRFQALVLTLLMTLSQLMLLLSMEWVQVPRSAKTRQLNESSLALELIELRIDLLVPKQHHHGASARTRESRQRKLKSLGQASTGSLSKFWTFLGTCFRDRRRSINSSNHLRRVL